MKSSLEIAQEAVLEPIDAMAIGSASSPRRSSPTAGYKSKISLDASSGSPTAPTPSSSVVAGMTPPRRARARRRPRSR